MTMTMHSKENRTCNGPEPHSTGIFLALCVTGIVSATVGNTLVCVAVYKTKTLRTSANYLLVSLSTASLLFVPVLVGYAFSLTISECDPRIRILCTWTSNLDLVLFCVVMLHLLIISLDRLVAIKLPMRYAMKQVFEIFFRVVEVP